MAFLETGRGTVTKQHALTVGANLRRPNSPWGLACPSTNDRRQSDLHRLRSNQKMRNGRHNMTDNAGAAQLRLSEDSQLSLTGQLSNYAGGLLQLRQAAARVRLPQEALEPQRLDLRYRTCATLQPALTTPATAIRA